MGLYDLPTPSLLDDEDEYQTSALAALASQANPQNDIEAMTPQLDPVSQFSADDIASMAQTMAPPPAAPDPGPAFSALATANDPPPMELPTTADLEAPPPAKPDPYEALMQRGEQERQRALEQYGKEEPSVNGWAILADAVFNKGRSIPGILQDHEANKRAWQEGRRKLLVGSGSTDPVNQMLAMERIKNAQQTNQLRGDAAEAKAAKDQKAAEADALAGERIREYAKTKGFYTPDMEGLGGGALQKQFNLRLGDKKLADAPQVAQNKATEAGLVTHARNRQNADDADLLEQASYARGKGNFGAQAEYLPEKPETPNEKANRERQEELLRIAQEGEKRARRKEIDDVTRKDAGEREDFNRNYSKDTDSAVKMAQSIKAIEATLDGHPGLAGLENTPMESVTSAVLGEGPVQKMRGLKVAMSKNPKVREDNDLLISLRADYASLNADALKEATGLGSNLSEQDKTEIRTGAKPDATVAQMRAGLKALKRGVTSKLSRFGGTRADWADENLEASGLDPVEWAPGIKRKPKSAAAPAAAGGGEELGDGETLVTNEDGEQVIDYPGRERDQADFADVTPQPSAKRADRPVSEDGGNLGVKAKPPKVSSVVDKPQNIGGTDQFDVIVNGKHRRITRDQIHYLEDKGVRVIPYGR